MNLISYEIDYKIKAIRQTKVEEWTDEKIASAIEILNLVNPTIELLDVIKGGFRPEIVIRGTFAGKTTVFRAAIPRVCDCVVNDVPFHVLTAKESERAEELRLTNMKYEAQRKITEKKAADDKKKAEIESIIKAVNMVIDHFVRSALSGTEVLGMQYHVTRCRNLPEVSNSWNPISRSEAMTPKTNGQFLEIGRECCFLPKALNLNFKSGAGWRCKSKAQAEAIAKAWNARLDEVMHVLESNQAHTKIST